MTAYSELAEGIKIWGGGRGQHLKTLIGLSIWQAFNTLNLKKSWGPWPPSVPPALLLVSFLDLAYQVSQSLKEVHLLIFRNN